MTDRLWEAEDIKSGCSAIERLNMERWLRNSEAIIVGIAIVIIVIAYMISRFSN